MVAERVMMFVVLAACGGDSSRRVERGSAPVPAIDAPEVTPAIDANDPVAVPIDASDPVAVDAVVDAGATNRTCFCFSWVHRDENGESCYDAKPTCDTEFKGYARNDKIACRTEQRASCGSYACRGGGKECFKLR